MRIAIVSDIHGNRHAFEAVLDAIEASDCEELWCLGDLVGYGADPGRLRALTREHAAICLAGNHDLGIRGTLPLEQFSRGAALAATWTRETITPETLELPRTARALEPRRGGRSVPRQPARSGVGVRPLPLQAELCLDVQPQRVALIGHSHVALSFSRVSGRTGHRPDSRPPMRSSTSARASGCVNPGSVGQPRDGDPRAAWLELDLDNWHAIYRRIEYDIAGAAAAIRAARLPGFARRTPALRPVGGNDPVRRPAWL